MMEQDDETGPDPQDESTSWPSNRPGPQTYDRIRFRTGRRRATSAAHRRACRCTSTGLGRSSMNAVLGALDSVADRFGPEAMADPVALRAGLRALTVPPTDAEIDAL